MTAARGECALDLLSLSYSAGVDVTCLRAFFPDILDYYEEYALYSEAYNASPEGMHNPGPHIAIADVEFTRANRLLCFAILLGWTSFLPRIMTIIEYNNPILDAMLERLASAYIDRPQPFPAECARHLPYDKTLAVFDAPLPERPKLMRKYLGGWYRASRRKPYYESHTNAKRYLGYWSWESAAMTVALDIDDASYRGMPYYPETWSTTTLNSIFGVTRPRYRRLRRFVSRQENLAHATAFGSRSASRLNEPNTPKEHP